jgi:hypothetical protein
MAAVIACLRWWLVDPHDLSSNSAFGWALLFLAVPASLPILALSLALGYFTMRVLHRPKAVPEDIFDHLYGGPKQ